jgi:hypothetical protein
VQYAYGIDWFAVDWCTVEEYAESMREHGWGDFPAVVAFHDPARMETYLAEGWHRYHAARLAVLPGVRAEVRKGTREDAIDHATTANAKHGLRRTRDDKQRAVYTTVFCHPTWKHERIAGHCGVSQQMVSYTLGSVRDTM